MLPKTQGYVLHYKPLNEKKTTVKGAIVNWSSFWGCFFLGFPCRFIATNAGRIFGAS